MHRIPHRLALPAMSAAALRNLLAAGVFALLTALTACGGGSGSGSDSTAVSPSPAPGGTGGPGILPPPNPESGPESIGVFAGFSGDLAWDPLVTGVQGGDGGVGGGADGGGGVGAGGSLGQFRNALVYALLDDGTTLGPATTDPDTGMVTVRPGRTYAGSLIVELVGQGGTEYFDEAKGGWVAFPAGQKLRAHVDKIRGNIGVTPLTEAAVAHAESDLQLAQLPLPERARQSNERIRLAVNSRLPASYAVDHVARLPQLLNPASGKGALPDTPAGRYGTVVAALTFAASQFNPPLVAPGLSVATQLARDLQDGRLNGVGPGGASLAPADQLAYDSTELAGQLVAAIDRVNERYGVDAGDPALPQVAEFGEYAAAGIQRRARLMSDGRVLVSEASGSIESPLPANPDLPQTALPATALYGDGAAMLIRRTDGSIQAVGTNPFAGASTPSSGFRFGIASPESTLVPVAAAAALSQSGGATDIVFGSAHALARTAGGRALAWGNNAALQTGVAGTGVQVAPQAVPLSGGVRAVAASLEFSLALLNDGSVVSWGSERRGALGRGPNALFAQLPGAVQVQGGGSLTGVVSVVAAGATALAVRLDGSVWGWGEATGGLLGDEAEAFRYVAEPVNGLAATRKIVPVGNGLVALDENGVVRFWGNIGSPNGEGGRVLPAPLANLPPIRDIQDRGAGNTVALGYGDETFVLGPAGVLAR